MRNILKKTAGVIITVSMLSTMLAGCANVDNTNVDNTNADNTNSNIEASVDNDTETDFDSGTKTVDPSTGKVLLEFNGVSVEGTDNNYECISAYSVLDDNTKGTIVYEEVKDIICISMRYVNYALAVNSYTQEPETKLAEKVKVSIPYEEGMYILANENGVAYDIPAEYIDGKYVFETNRLGEFIISTVSTGKTEPTKTENVELAQQTITDERTGVTVSGMLPVDARLGVSLYCMDDTDASHVIDWATCYEDVYQKTPELLEYIIVDDTKTRIEEMINYEGWGEEEYVSNGAKIGGAINFIKDFEVLDFESDITVTLPFDYHHALDISVLDADYLGKATAIQYDYDKRKFVELDIVPEKETEKDTFQFTAKFPGYFFLGGEERIDDFKLLYTNLNNGEY